MRTSIVIGLLLALGAAGCGGGKGNDGVATAGGRSTKAAGSAKPNAQGDALKFARCMRQHGVNMPDPKVQSGGGVSITVQKGTAKTTVDAATKQCKQYMPGGGEPQKLDPNQLERARNLAKCMRAHGVPKFPDPDSNGGISIKGGPELDPRSPQFKAADKACAQYRGGKGGTVQVGTGQ